MIFFRKMTVKQEINNPAPSCVVLTNFIIKVAAGEKQTINTEDMGDLANRYLMVYNPNADLKGEWTVEFI